MNSTPPTHELTRAFQAMYDHFNRELFDGQLAPVILNFSRRAKSAGFFAPNRWMRTGATEAASAGVLDEGAVRHEISINPAYMSLVKPIDLAQTLVHEMAHLWQQQFGNPSRSGYHNKQWAAKMESIGLMPSSTGKPDGDKTGQHMADYPIEGGQFLAALGKLPTDSWFPWIGRPEPKKEKETKEAKKRSKTKYGCPSCDLNVWGKPGLQLRCDDCDELLDEEAA